MLCINFSKVSTSVRCSCRRELSALTNSSTLSCDLPYVSMVCTKLTRRRQVAINATQISPVAETKGRN